MSFTTEQKALLSAKLDPSHVKQREQSGRKLSYIEGWHAIAEANRIFGFDGWTRETMDIRLVSERERPIGRDGAKGWGVSYVAHVRITVAGIMREGIGAGHGIDRDLGLAHESAIKEAETDAMKRALMTFGNPFGLALYDKEQANVGVDAPEPPPAAKPKPADSPALATLTAGLKACRTPDDVDEFANTPTNRAAMGVLSNTEFKEFQSRITRWKAHIGKAAA